MRKRVVPFWYNRSKGKGGIVVFKVETSNSLLARLLGVLFGIIKALASKLTADAQRSGPGSQAMRHVRHDEPG
jgi:hypothetical protein